MGRGSSGLPDCTLDSPRLGLKAVQEKSITEFGFKPRTLGGHDLLGIGDIEELVH